MTHDGPIARCVTKVRMNRDQAIAEATRLGFPVNPYRCPNGNDHWHVGNSKKDGELFHRQYIRWESLRRNRKYRRIEDVPECPEDE